VAVGPEHEAPRPPSGSGFTDSVTVAFGDPRADLYGSARLSLADGAATGLVLVFHRGAPAAVRAESGRATAAPASFGDVSAAGLRHEVVEPLRSWRLRFASDEARLDLALAALGAVTELAEDHPVARLGGQAGYEQACRVTGHAEVAGRRLAVDGLGQRGHGWGIPARDGIERARTVAAWLGDEVAVSLTAVRPARARDHEAEEVAATILEHGPPRALAVADPRLSTTYDAEGRQRTAGLELYVNDDDPPRRAAGEVVCGTSLDLGGRRLHCAFLRWRMEGRTGFGRYDILRRA
jgi:hypothetical protein